MKDYSQQLAAVVNKSGRSLDLEPKPGDGFGARVRLDSSLPAELVQELVRRLAAAWNVSLGTPLAELERKGGGR